MLRTSATARTEAVLREIVAGLPERASPLPLGVAGTLEPPSNSSEHLAAGEVGELPGAERGDLDAVEQLRQNRLRSWQTPADIGTRRL